ncbi:hypothetical protein [Mycobacteroides abscessus]|uniref:hypothetical protein n=1 Tax=Mycobacteroides abscessus TaxID=36809 RepID=UPI001056FB85|nr:hypothetical protein [Mycobacteroides abscessus]
MADESLKVDKLELGLKHAWGWYSLHAGQRMKVVNFFLIAVAFLTAAYVTALKDERPVVAAVVASAGAVTSVCFWILETRTCKLLEIGRTALVTLQAELNQLGGWTELDLAEKAKLSAHGVYSYRAVINLLTFSAALLFISAAVNAIQ